MRLFGIVLVILISACQQKNESITYKPYSDFFQEPANERLAKLKQAVESWQLPVTTELSLDSGWWFQKGSPSEGLVVTSIVSGGTKVTIPHRVVSPNTPLWYSNQLEFPSRGVLVIGADDGAQVFIDGRQRHQLRDEMFVIDSAGSYNISVRVLNNAMAGGLRRITFLTDEDFKVFDHHDLVYHRVKRLVEKAILFPVLSSEQLEAVEAAVGDHLNIDLIQQAENTFREFPFLTGPWITRIDSTKISITVLTDGDHPVTLQYGKSPKQLENVQTQEGNLAEFTVNASGTFYYTLSSGKTISPLYQVKAADPESFSFNVWADSQSGWEGFERNIQNLSAYGDAFGIAAGDLVAQGSDAEQWRIFFNLLSRSSSSIPYYLVAGNHDYDGYYDKLLPENYSHLTHRDTPYFSWYFGNCGFIAIDPNEKFPIGFSAEQKSWFVTELESTAWKRSTWRFIVLHQPPFSEGWAGYEGDACVRELLEPVMESAAIDFVIAGHTHDYERLSRHYGKQRTTFLIVGGAGGSLEPPESSQTFKMDTVIKTHHMGRFFVNENRIQFNVIDTDKKLIDSFEQVK